MSDVVPHSSSALAHPEAVMNDLQRFQEVVLSQLEAAGLPSDRVFVDVAERQRMLANVGGALDGVTPELLSRSHYVSKMVAAAAVGLFDAALNYLWDETVSELRRRVAGFDLAYFYDIAAPSSDIRKHLKTEEDLTKIDDANLLRASREIGLLTDVGFNRLDHVRYMRNHASAAHPNQVELSGLDLASWLEICVRQVITSPPDQITARTGRLLKNIKRDRLAAADVTATSAFFDQLSDDRADTLANGLFGLYTAEDRTPVVADNVRLLWPELWEYVSEDARHAFGLRFGRFQASADTAQAAAARELLDLVDGGAYLPEATRAVEIDSAVDALLAAHHGWNNFYTEVAPALRLEALVGDRGDVPDPVSPKYVKALVRVFLGNGHGVADAQPTYRRMLERLDGKGARRALRMFMDPPIASLLRTSVARGQWPKLLDVLEPKFTSGRDRELIQAVRDFSGSPEQLHLDTKISRLAAPKENP